MGKTGYLILENGTILPGISFGEETERDGEVVFNTGMVGYPEGFSDPSYARQILVCTYPLVGNYGVPQESYAQDLPDFFESEKIHIAGLIVSSYIPGSYHWQSATTLGNWLKKSHIPALSGIDTRTLTQTIRNHGVLKGRITFKNPNTQVGIPFYDINKENLVREVSCKKVMKYGKGKIRILVLDCGLKANQLKLLLKLDTTLIRVPWNYNPFKSGDQIAFDGLFISNGPGDPQMVTETIEIVKEALSRRIPTLGICLGHQILARASGARTYKLTYGHRGQNQPIIDEMTKKCYITTQNHGFAVDPKTLSPSWTVWFTNLNDKTNEGIRHTHYPFFSTQYHPESAPGPTDTEWIFSYFISEVEKWMK